MMRYIITYAIIDISISKSSGELMIDPEVILPKSEPFF